MRSLLLSPHCDDETLFASFLIQQHHPVVAICFTSERDYGDTQERFAESVRACHILGAPTVIMREPHVGTVEEFLRRCDEEVQPEIVWSPSINCSHPDHSQVYVIAASLFGDRLRCYDTYALNMSGRQERVRELPQNIPTGAQVIRKLLALAEYKTQIEHPRAMQFFLDPLNEFAEQP